jgi:hypothetical protein
VRQRQRCLILMCMRNDRYWPHDIAEVAEKVSLINEPLAAPDGTVALPVLNREKPLHAQVHTKELLAPLEAKGVRVPRDDQWQVVREVYVQTRLRSIRGARRKRTTPRPRSRSPMARRRWISPATSSTTPKSICRPICRFSTRRTSAIPSLTRINGTRWKIASSIFWAPGSRLTISAEGKSYVLPPINVPRWRARFQKIC